MDPSMVKESTETTLAALQNTERVTTVIHTHLLTGANLTTLLHSVTALLHLITGQVHHLTILLIMAHRHRGSHQEDPLHLLTNLHPTESQQVALFHLTTAMTTSALVLAKVHHLHPITEVPTNPHPIFSVQTVPRVPTISPSPTPHPTTASASASAKPSASSNSS
jgi:hypothetical protein